MKFPLAAVVVLSAGSATAQPYEISSFTIDGGATLSGATYTLSGTIGQPDAGAALTGLSYELTGSFWPGVADPGRLCADQNGDGLVTASDFSAWIANFNANDPKADVNQDGSVAPSDFSAWIAAFNQGTNGPTCNP